VYQEIFGSSIRRLDKREQNLCVFFNRACRRRRIAQFFTIISRLGDGIFWYALIGLLPLIYGHSALIPVMTMVVAGAVGIIIYTLLKSATARPRPFTSNPQIRREALPLDEFSFPSGHALHSASFTIIATFSFPELAWILVPFAALVAMSRVVLGLHYPSDVMVGLALGAVLGLASVAAQSPYW
jgi:undecaprenyl-diphosphatase